MKRLNYVVAPPLVDLSHLLDAKDLQLFAKCEFLNESLSLKDRMVKHILFSLASRRVISKGSRIVTASSGNTATSLAMLCSQMSYKSTVFVPNTCSQEKLDHMRAFGATIFIEEPNNYINQAKRYAASSNEYFIDQYNDPLNPDAYYRTLGPELWEATKGSLTHFVMAGSTCGCICGTSRFLKEMNPSLTTILVDTPSSRLYEHYYKECTNKNASESSIESLIEGVGKKFKPGCLDTYYIDKVVKIPDIDAIKMCRRVAERDGLLIGGSSGLNLAAVLSLQFEFTPGSVIATVLCDSGIKYLSKIFNDDYLTSKGVSLKP
jgi:cysteine synthase